MKGKIKNLFGAIGGFIKKHKKISILILVILALLIAFFVFMGVKAKQSSQQSSVETAQIEKRDLVESISASGTIESVKTNTVTCTESNVTCTSVKVQVGDTVTKGDVIAVLDSTEAEENLANAKKEASTNSQIQQIELTQTERSLDEATTIRDLDAEQNDADLSSSWQSYVNALQDLQEAELTYGAYYYAISSGSSSDYTSLSQAKDSYENAQTSASNALNSYKSKAVQIEESELKTNNQITTDQENITKTKLNQIISNMSSEQKIRQYQKEVDACTIKATATGTITSLSVNEGDTFSGGSVAVIEDTSGLQVSATVDEYDINKVEVGQTVVIKTNATDDKEYNGTITYVAPRATTSSSSSGSSSMSSSSSSSSVNYEVIASIDDADEDLRMDMTAKLSIVIDEAKDALTVPYDAVQEDADGNYYIEVIDDSMDDAAAADDAKDSAAASEGTGQAPADSSAAPAASDGTAAMQGNMPDGAPSGGPSGMPSGNSSTSNTKKITVTKGLESDYYIEVSGDGIKEGMTVIVPTSTNSSNSGNDMDMRMGEGGGGPMGGF